VKKQYFCPPGSRWIRRHDKEIVVVDRVTTRGVDFHTEVMLLSYRRPVAFFRKNFKPVEETE